MDVSLQPLLLSITVLLSLLLLPDSGAETVLDNTSKRSPRDGTLQLLLLLIATMPYLLPNQWQ